MSDQVSDQEPEHLHLASSFEQGWQGLNLILEREPRGEMPEAEMTHHFLAIALGDFRGSYEVGGVWQSLDYATGDVVILPQTELFPHVAVDREVPLLELFLEPEMIRSIAPSAQIEPQLQMRDPLIQHMGYALYQAVISGGAENALYAESMGIALSAHLVKHYSSARSMPVKGGFSARDRQLLQDYIATHLDQTLTIAHLSQRVGFSEYHFSQLFRQSFGMTPHQYLLQVRIDRAKQLLRKTRDPILAIVYQVGFQNQSHFTRVFRQQVGCTPRQFRNQ